MKKRALLVIMAAIILITSLSGCGKDSGSDKTLSYPVAQEPESLDPQTARGNSSLTAIYNSMVTPVRIDSNGNVQPYAALSWEISQNGTVYTFRLREDIKWHKLDTTDEMTGGAFNETVTAEDFAFGITRALLPETNSPFAANFSSIKNAEGVLDGSLSPEMLGVSAPDSRTLRITLERRDPNFIFQMATCGAMPCDKIFFEATGGRYGLDVDYFLACGPFYLSKWNHDASLILRKNDSYFDKASVKPASVILYIQDEATSADDIGAGKLSAALLMQDYAEKFDGKKYKPAEYPSDTFCMMVCSNALTALTSPEVRRAFALAMNPEGFINEGHTPAEGLIPDFCRSGADNYREKAGKADIPAMNGTLARELWDKELKRLGIKSLEITVLCADEDEKIVRDIIRQWQNAFGISFSAKIAVVSPDEVYNSAQSGIYQIAFTRVSADSSDAETFLRKFAGGYGVVSENYTELLQKLAAEGDSVKKIELLRECENFLIQNGYFYPIYEQSRVFVHSKDCENIVFSQHAGVPLFEGGECFD